MHYIICVAQKENPKSHNSVMLSLQCSFSVLIPFPLVSFSLLPHNFTNWCLCYPHLFNKYDQADWTYIYIIFSVYLYKKARQKSLIVNVLDWL